MTDGWVTRLVRATSVPTRTRCWLAIVCGLIAGGVTVQSNIHQTRMRDFAQVWYAAHAVLRHADPYALIGSGRTFPWDWPFLYPLPAAIVALPFSVLSWQLASVLFIAIGGGCFAWALMEYGYAPLFGFFGAPLHYAAETAQWSPLLSASIVIAPLAFFLVAKPTVGFAYFAARPSRWAIAGGLVLGGLALAIQPTWIHDWLGAVATNNAMWLPYHPYQPPVLYPGGALALLALLRWRRPEARLLAVLACVPQTGALYENVPLFLIPRSFPEVATLVGLSYVQTLLTVDRDVIFWPQAMHDSGLWSAILLFVPATIMVLRRPNEGVVPAWIERAIAALRGATLERAG